MEFYKPYDGTQPTYRIDYDSFPKQLNYLSPKLEKLLRARYSRLPKYNPLVKRLNTPEITGCCPKIMNY